MDHYDFKYYIPISDKVALTEVNQRDRTALIKYLSDKEIFLQTFAIPYPYGESEADWFLTQMKEKMSTEHKPTTMAIRKVEDHSLIGVFGFHGFEPGDHKVEIGYWLAKPYWNKGIATQVVEHMSRFAFEDLKVARVYAKAFARNIGSIRVLQKAGFCPEGVLRKDVIKEGEHLDVALFGLLKTDQTTW